MKYTFRQNGGSHNELGDLPFKPRTTASRKDRGNSNPKGFLKRVQNLSQKATQSISSMTCGYGKGIIVSNPKLFSQRVVIKSHFVRARSARKGAIFNHIGYLQRDGVGLDRKEPKAFSLDRELETKEVQDWAEKCTDDRHHFRFIVSPENASELDLPLLTKKLMRQMESDVGSKLDWIAVCHHNTDNPHIHILVRGVDEHGKDLVINRDYMSLGFRNRAQEIATKELGPRTPLDIEKEIQRSITQARIIGLDRELAQELACNKTHVLDVRQTPPVAFQTLTRNRNNRIRRLQFLEQLGLAKETESGLWHVDERLLEKLHSLSIQNDIIKSMYLRTRDAEPPVEMVIFDAKRSPEKSFTGEVVHIGLANELYDEKYVILRTRKGQAVYIALGAESANRNLSFSRGDEVRITTTEKSLLTKADQNITEFAEQNGSIYNPTAHIEYVQKNVRLPQHISAEDFVANHRRRLNSLARMGLAEELIDGQWRISSNLVKQLQGKVRRDINIERLEKKRELDKGSDRER